MRDRSVTCSRLARIRRTHYRQTDLLTHATTCLPHEQACKAAVSVSQAVLILAGVSARKIGLEQYPGHVENPRDLAQGWNQKGTEGSVQQRREDLISSSEGSCAAFVPGFSDKELGASCLFRQPFCEPCGGGGIVRRRRLHENRCQPVALGAVTNKAGVRLMFSQ